MTTYFDNGVSGIPPARHRSGRALRTLAQRLKGKEGRFRSNLSGKRVDFSARTVISPDPNLSMNEVGVPEEIAKILTIPQRVTEWNLEKMKELVIRGPDKHPGCNYLIRTDGRRVDLRFVKDRHIIADTIEPGFIVERHLANGDIVLFNRQPSLHRMSIMAHEVRVMPYRTFRLSLFVCMSGDTELYTDLGRVPIADIAADYAKYAPLSCNWDKDKSVYFSGVTNFHIIKPSQLGLKSYKVTTENGRIIKVTAEHPFYTRRGIVKAGELQCTDAVAVYPIEIPPVGGCPNILTQEQILTEIADLTFMDETLKELEDMDLIDVPAGSRKQIQLAKLVGHLFGDGVLRISGEESRVIFRASDSKDISGLWTTARDLNLDPTPIQRLQTHGPGIIETEDKDLNRRSNAYFFEVRQKSIALAFRALGVPEGDKTNQEYRVPKWLFEAPKMAKRAFLRAYFGCEVSAPQVYIGSDSKFSQPTFEIVKREGVSAEGFINDIQSLLGEFDVRLSSIISEESNLQKDGRKLLVYACSFDASEDNLLALFKRIGYEFNHKKEKLARLASEYITFKKHTKAKVSAQFEREIALREQEHCSGEEGLPVDFPGFDRWRESATQGLEDGFVWDKIAAIEEIELEYAYDITTSDDNHNFVAAEFLTKNCPPYNADFDGDEMNLHVPQSEEARAEARVLMRVQEQILSPRYGGPIIGALQDYITAAFLLTRRSSLYTRNQVNQFMATAGYEGELPDPAIRNPVELWTGKQIFSMFIPQGITISFKAKICRGCSVCKKEDCEYDAYVVIRNGQLLFGVVDEKAFGAGEPDSLFHRIIKECGSTAGRVFIDTLGRLLVRLITERGFTMGLDDVSIPRAAQERIRVILDAADAKVKQLIEVYKRGELDPNPGQSLLETLEKRIMEVLSEARKTAGAIAGEHLGLDNSAVIMAQTGARGSNVNLSQMAAVVGQQSVRGERVLRGYTARTLPHFEKGDLGARAHGFVRACYKTGLDPLEYWFHAAGGRESLVDTAVRTSTSGYMQRRLMTALQDLKVETDGTVRTAPGRIVQFRFGDDGVDPSKSDHGRSVNVNIIVEKILGRDQSE